MSLGPAHIMSARHDCYCRYRNRPPDVEASWDFISSGHGQATWGSPPDSGLGGILAASNMM